MRASTTMLRLATVALTVAGLTGIGAAGAGAATTPAASTARPCLPADHDGPWPAWADGQPAADPGVRVWHSATGWHVRVTHDSLHDRVFAGEILTSGRIASATP